MYSHNSKIVQLKCFYKFKDLNSNVVTILR